MAEKYRVAADTGSWSVVSNRGSRCGIRVASFWTTELGTCPNAEREAKNLCRRLNAAAKKGKVKR